MAFWPLLINTKNCLGKSLVPGKKKKKAVAASDKLHELFLKIIFPFLKESLQYRLADISVSIWLQFSFSLMFFN